jgi:hypothetical protein
MDELPNPQRTPMTYLVGQIAATGFNVPADLPIDGPGELSAKPQCEEERCKCADSNNDSQRQQRRSDYSFIVFAGVDKRLAHAIIPDLQQCRTRDSLEVPHDTEDKDARIEDANPNQLQRVPAPQRIKCKRCLHQHAQNEHGTLQRHDIGPRDLVHDGIYPGKVLQEQKTTHTSQPTWN